MQSLALIVLFVAAASAFPTDKYFYRCIPYLSDHSFVYKEKTFLCDSYDGRRYVVAKNNYINDWDVNFDDFVALQNTRHIPFGGAGIGGAGSASHAQSSAGSLGGSIGGGLLPFSLSGSASGAQSSAGSVAGGGGLGFLG